MTSLTDFKPLRRLSLPELEDVPTSGLVLIVGPNSSGKSQLLRDIYHRCCGEPRTLVVAKEIALNTPSYEDLIANLESDGYFTSIVDDNGNRILRPSTTYVGSGQAINQITFDQGASWHSKIPTKDTGKRPVEFYNFFGRLLTTGLFLDRRLVSANQVGLINFEASPPQADLHALYTNELARKRLLDEMVSSFGRAVWPDISRGDALLLRVSDEGVLPSAEDRLSPRAMSQYRTIETEGDGLKSYIATCISLLLGRRPVCIIDEPEMCLHPPQAYNLGRFIGRFGSSKDTVTFVATHSSHILRGVLQTTDQMQIVRLGRTGSSFRANHVSPEELTRVLAKPTVRAESVLDGIFSHAVVIVEADGDRHLYQTVWERLGGEFAFDIHFTVVGGTGGIADTAQFYRALRIPVGVIADLDILSDIHKLSRVVSTLATSEDEKHLILEKAREVINGLRTLAPDIAPEDLVRDLKEIATHRMNWSEGDDHHIKRSLGKISARVDRLRSLKRGGIAKLSGAVVPQLVELVELTATIGLFMVPVGELEEWLAEATPHISKKDKWAWANQAASVVKAIAPAANNVWHFMRGVGSYLERRLPRGRAATA